MKKLNLLDNPSRKYLLYWIQASPRTHYNHVLKIDYIGDLRNDPSNGKHNRAWKEREIFGKGRYMNANGLRRKFKIEKYVENIDKVDINEST